MPIEFSCPHCRKPLEVDDEFAGRQAMCPYCDALADVPLATAARPAPQQEALQSLSPAPRPLQYFFLGVAALTFAMGAFVTLGAAMVMLMSAIPPELRTRTELSQEDLQRIQEILLEKPAILTMPVLAAFAALLALAMGIFALAYDGRRNFPAAIGVFLAVTFLVGMGCLILTGLSLGG